MLGDAGDTEHVVVEVFVVALPAATVASPALRKVAKTFAGVPDGRDTALTLRLLAHFLDPQLACAAQGQSPDLFDIW